MITKSKARFTRDAVAKTITVIKEVDAPVEKVWEAFTKKELLEKWWGPKPWNAVTKKMDFREGGAWQYKMVGPGGEQQWDHIGFETIDAPHQFTATSYFTDEKGKKQAADQTAHWTNSFKQAGNETTIKSVLKFDTRENMDKILKTGFEEGYAKGLDQLQELLEQ